MSGGLEVSSTLLLEENKRDVLWYLMPSFQGDWLAILKV